MKHIWIIIVIVLLILSILSVTLIYLVVKERERVAGISNFEECASHTGIIQTSYPPVCRLPDGRTFVKDVPPVEWPQSR